MGTRGWARGGTRAAGAARTRRCLLGLAVLAGTLAGWAATQAPAPPTAGATTATHVTWSKLSPATSPTARYGASMVYDASSSSTVLFGGFASGPAGDTWTWNGTTWTKRTPATSPTARYAASMAYDPATGNAVLFGGARIGGTFGDTWTWNGTTWASAAPATSPTARDGAAMAFDPATGNVVLFGGYSSAALADTWTWNGTTWTKLNPPTSPTARYRASMAYDPATGNLVLFGGLGRSSRLADTWTWNGATWTKLSPATSPTARTESSMTYDPATGNLVLFGGHGATGDLADTWTWNGATWTKLSPATSPTARYGASMVYDTSTASTMLFGGYAASGFLTDTWILATVPGKPGTPTVLAGNAQATVTWTAPTATGGTPVTGYTVTSSPTAKTCTVGGTATSCTVTGLRNNFTYTFTVRAANANGTGATSTPSTPVTPESTTPGFLTLSCGTAPVQTPATAVTCDTITLGGVSLDGTNQVGTAPMHPLYIATTRDHPTDNWSLYAQMVPSAETLTHNTSCDTVVGFCNVTTADATTVANHLANTSILPNHLSLQGFTCSADRTQTSPFYTTNPTPTTHLGRTVDNPTGLSTALELCTAATGSSSGGFKVSTGVYSLVVPPNVYAGTYYGTVQYTLVPGGVS